jgi:alkaline phosphatase D
MMRTRFVRAAVAASLLCTHNLSVQLAHANDAPPVTPTTRVTLPKAHKGTLDVDTQLLDSYGKLPDHIRQFYLDARAILTASPTARIADPKIIAAAQKAQMPLISGPMLGNITHSSVDLWFRPVTAGLYTATVSGATQASFTIKTDTPGASVRITCSDLKAGAEHSYVIVNHANAVVGSGRFTVAPAPGSKATTRIAFGSCFHKIGVHNPNLMRLVAKRANHAMLLLGDMAVDDREAALNMHESDYLLRDVSKPWRDLAASTPVYASWDDHDYLNNDKSGLQKGQITDDQRNDLRQLWHTNWVNPPVPVKDRGIYFNTRIGDIEVIMLDTRSCRDWDKRQAAGAYLGDAQKQWLLKTLKASTATFIVMTSGTMWTDYISNGKDSWGTWDTETREEIFTFLETNNIGGVLLLSGDRHGARGFKIERPSGYTLYEFEAATLGAVPGPKPFGEDGSAQLFGYGKMFAFGEFTFDMSKDDPTVTFRLIDEHEKALEEIIIQRSQLGMRTGQ